MFYKIFQPYYFNIKNIIYNIKDELTFKLLIYFKK